MSRLTLTYGGRYDYFNASTPEQHGAAGRFMSPAANAARADIAPSPACRAGTTGRSERGVRTTCSRPARRRSRRRSGSSSDSRRSALRRRPTRSEPERHPRVERPRQERHHLRRDRQRAIQRAGRDGEQQLRHPGSRYDPVRPDLAAADQLGGERVGAARAVSRASQSPRATTTDTFTHIQYTKNTLDRPGSPTTRRSRSSRPRTEPAGRRRAVDHVYNLNPAKRGIVNNVLTYSDKTRGSTTGSR